MMLPSSGNVPYYCTTSQPPQAKVYYIISKKLSVLLENDILMGNVYLKSKLTLSSNTISQTSVYNDNCTHKKDLHFSVCGVDIKTQ